MLLFKLFNHIFIQRDFKSFECLIQIPQVGGFTFMLQTLRLNCGVFIYQLLEVLSLLPFMFINHYTHAHAHAHTHILNFYPLSSIFLINSPYFQSIFDTLSYDFQLRRYSKYTPLNQRYIRKPPIFIQSSFKLQDQSSRKSLFKSQAIKIQFLRANFNLFFTILTICFS